MTETTKSAEQVVKHLNSLIELDCDAIEAYEAAIARLQNAQDKAKLREFMGDHQRHVADLSPMVMDLGGKPAQKADFKKVLTKGKVVLAALVGDRAILEAMRSNELATTKTYGVALTEPDLPGHVRTALERNFAHEQRHLAWIAARAVETEHNTDHR